MQETLTNQELENLDLSKIAALQQKRTLAFVNHFLITTVQFLNTFSKTCEKKLMQFQEKLEKVEATMILLETRLSSIPELNDTSIIVKKDSLDSSQTKLEKDIKSTAQTSTVETKPNDMDDSKCNDNVQTKPEYEKFIKMVQVGVPLEAVKLKVSLEGLDPGELDSLLKK